MSKNGGSRPAHQYFLAKCKCACWNCFVARKVLGGLLNNSGGRSSASTLNVSSPRLICVTFMNSTRRCTLVTILICVGVTTLYSIQRRENGWRKGHSGCIRDRPARAGNNTVLQSTPLGHRESCGFVEGTAVDG